MTTTFYIRLAAYLLTLGLFSLLLFRPRKRTPLQRQRDAARRAGLDTYTPQTRDRFWNDWTDHHGGGIS